MVSTTAAAPEKMIALPARPASGSVAAILFIGLLALLIFGVLAFGATEPWAAMVQQIAIAGLTIIWTIGWMATSLPNPRFNLLYLPWALVIVIVGLQIALKVPPYFGGTIAA